MPRRTFSTIESNSPYVHVTTPTGPVVLQEDLAGRRCRGFRPPLARVAQADTVFTGSKSRASDRIMDRLQIEVEQRRSRRDVRRHLAGDTVVSPFEPILSPLWLLVFSA